MAFMTFAVTIAFLVRSSSLVGWVPLAVFKMFSSYNYFVAVMTAGVFVTIPVISASILTDSIYYGKFAFP